MRDQVLARRVPVIALLFGIALTAFTLVWVRNAWMSDDAYITLRTVYNVLHGLGPDFNPGERVQSFTHPLWFLLLIPTHALSGEGYYSTLALSFVTSLATLLVLVRYLARTPQQGLFPIALMLLSKTYIDFSSSGLENPLSNFCLALFFILLFAEKNSPRRLLYTTLAAACGTLARFDLILILLPPLGWVTFQVWHANPRARGRVVAALGVGFLPLFVWLLWSSFYYGIILPNTYYAKTPANVPLTMWLEQGANYFLNSLHVDPLTLTVIAFAILLALYKRSPAMVAIALGIVFYLVYVLKNGGDFMSGRFFTAPFFCALIILARANELANWKILVPLGIAACVLGLRSPTPPIFSDETFGATTDAERIALVGADRVSEQRGFYYHWTGLLLNLQNTQQLEQLSEVREGEQARQQPYRVLRTTGLGIRSYYAGPTKYAIDEMALADPFLAWLPRKEGWWIIGHFARCAPIGYARTLNGKVQNPKRVLSKRNWIQDPELAAFYDDLSLLNRGKLWDTKRLWTILKFNMGGYDALRSHVYPCENFWNGKPDPTIAIAQ